MSAVDVRAVPSRRSAQTTSDTRGGSALVSTGMLPRSTGREAGEGDAPALPGHPRTLSLHARYWANPTSELPVLPGAGGWDVGAA